MGAVGITMGTRFLATKECNIPLSLKLHLSNNNTNEHSTVLVLRSLNNSTRVIKNDISLKILELEKEKSDFSKLAPYVSGQRTKKMFLEDGNWNDAMWYLY
jgi:NAD(P)H-dependent flavin oxidoreductase YrpB (nitropropane dioxygenase family)